MGVVVGLGFGVGLLLIWSAFAVPRSSFRFRGGRLDGLLSRAGLGGVSVTSFVALCLVCGVITGLAVQVASRTAPVAVAFAVLGGYLLVAVTLGRARRRQREFAEVWPEAVDNLASGVRAGLSLPEALSALSVRGPEPLRAAFAGFALDYQVTGRFGASLDRLKDRLADRSEIGSSKACGWRGRSEEEISAGCGAACPASCATTPAPAPSSRRDRAGR